MTRLHVKTLSLFLALAGVVFAIVSSLSMSAPTQAAFLNVFYQSTVNPTGGAPPYTLTLFSGQLPPGLTLNSTTGAITGTPQVPGSFSFVIQLQDQGGVPTGNSPADAARRRTGFAAASINSPTFTINVNSGVPGTPVPPSVWLAMLGLAFAGLYKWRSMRHA